MNVSKSVAAPPASRLAFRPPPVVSTTDHGLPVDHYSPSARAEPSEPSGWKRAGQALALGCSLAAGFLAPMAPLVSLGAPSTVSQATRIERALQNSSVRRLYDSLPGNIRSIAGDLSDAQTRVLKNGASGQSKVGPMTVDHRKAFIKGTVLGRPIWSNVKQQITDARTKHHMINRSEERELHTLIDQVARLKPEQREDMVRLLDHVRF